MTESYIAVDNWLCQGCKGNLVTTLCDVVCSECGLVQNIHAKIEADTYSLENTYPMAPTEPKLTKLHRICRILDTTKTTEAVAAYIVKKTDLLRRIYPDMTTFSRGEIITGSLYIGVRHRKEHIPLAQLIEVARTEWSKITQTKLLRCASAIRSYLHVSVSPVKPEEYFPIILGKIMRGETCKIIKRAHTFLDKIPQQVLTGRNPYILAGAIIYDILRSSSYHKITQEELAERMDISCWSLVCVYKYVVKPYRTNGG